MGGTFNVNESMNGNVGEGVNIITDNMNNNIVSVIVIDSFADYVIVDTGSFLSFVDNNFPHNFQKINNLSTNIWIGVNFIRKYNCVPYVSQGVFSLGDARITVPLVVRGDTLGLTKLREQVTLQPNTQRLVRLNCPKRND